jgi:phage protein D
MSTQFPDSVAPNFRLTVNNNLVDASVLAHIQQVEYESNDGLADLLRIMIQDTLDERKRFPTINSKLFLPGNDVSLWGGYGNSLKHIGRCVIRKAIPTFPRSGAPTLEVICYTPDAQMADTGPEALKDVSTKKGRRVKNAKAGRRWSEGSRYSDAVIDKAQAYGFIADVDSSHVAPDGFIQKANMKDYAFLKGLANFTGFIMWVDGAENGKYTLHFKDPAKLKQADLQDKKYTFKYGDGEYSTLLEFQPEIAISQGPGHGPNAVRED